MRMVSEAFIWLKPPTPEKYFLGPMLRWELLQVDIGGLETEQELLDAIDEQVATCSEQSEGRSVVYRLVLNGRGPPCGPLRSEVQKSNE